MRQYSEQQKRYLAAKAAYDEAFQAEEWDTVEKLEDEYLDAEQELVEWMFAEAEKSDKMPAHELSILRKHWVDPKYTERIVNMAMKLAA